MDTYPRYVDYNNTPQNPSVLAQHFPILDGCTDEQGLFYPKTDGLEENFLTNDQTLKFGAARFCGFLHDTIGVEHNLVIPAISSASLLQCDLPAHALEDLYKLVTDEGHHAAQALVYMNSVAKKYDINVCGSSRVPKFLQRLGRMRSELSDPNDRLLFDVLSGVVTETRISVELSEFAINTELVNSVRQICQSHQEDEAIHSSQFRSLGRWIWSQLDGEKRSLAASLFAQIMIARSLPDIDRLAFYLSESTEIIKQDAQAIVKDIYTPDRLMRETLFAAKPTLRFFTSLGVTEFDSFKDSYSGYDWEAVAYNEFSS
jgi:hypothetical protein